MTKIEITISKITDYSSYPGWVECVLHDVWNNRHIFIDKIPIFTCCDLSPESTLPQIGFIRCEIIKEWFDDMDRKIITVCTEKPDGLETVEGYSKFDLLESQVSFCTE